MSSEVKEIDDMMKMVGVLLAGFSLTIGLVASWSHFFAEQKVNTVYRELQGKVVESHAKEIIRLNENQGKIIVAVSNNTKNNSRNTDALKELSTILHQNQLYLTKIASKVGVDE